MSANVRAAITEKLRPYAGTRFDSGLALHSGEQADFWWDLEPVITAAGWIHVPWTGTGDIVRQGNRVISGAVAAANVEVHLHSQSEQQLLPATTALIWALEDVGIAARHPGFNCNSGNTNAVHILIGDKQ
jgi:hypothetical protein